MDPGRDLEPDLGTGAGLNPLDSGDIAAAIGRVAALIRAQPACFENYDRMGSLMQRHSDRASAKQWYTFVLGLPPPSPSAHHSQIKLGLLCGEMGLDQEAEEHLLGALASERLSAPEYLRVGVALAKLGQVESARAALVRSLRLEPTPSGWTELGHCHFRAGDATSAEVCYREALRYDPEYAAAHANLGLVLLYRGEYVHGFEELEWRARLSTYYRIQGFQAPRWAGEPLEGKTILLHAEQGFGDTLQFLRFIPLVASRGAKVLLVVQAALHRLAAAYPGVAECIPIGAGVPEIDFHCPLMSLPFVLGTTIESIPQQPAWTALPADPESSGGSRSSPLQVGLVWAGGRHHLTDNERSFPLSALRGLAKLGDAASFLSLQHGPSAKELTENAVPFVIRDGCSGAKDFAETAQVIAGLDLVITVDTAVAHLAGSMGKKVWVLLGRVPEWRWGPEGETTPWYPSMRLFRMEGSTGWTSLIEKVVVELKVLCIGRTGG